MIIGSYFIGSALLMSLVFLGLWALLFLPEAWLLRTHCRPRHVDRAESVFESPLSYEKNKRHLPGASYAHVHVDSSVGPLPRKFSHLISAARVRQAVSDEVPTVKSRMEDQGDKNYKRRFHPQNGRSRKSSTSAVKWLETELGHSISPASIL